MTAARNMVSSPAASSKKTAKHGSIFRHGSSGDMDQAYLVQPPPSYAASVGLLERMWSWPSYIGKSVPGGPTVQAAVTGAAVGLSSLVGGPVAATSMVGPAGRWAGQFAVNAARPTVAFDEQATLAAWRASKVVVSDQLELARERTKQMGAEAQARIEEARARIAEETTKQADLALQRLRLEMERTKQMERYALKRLVLESPKNRRSSSA
ncbi:uncharacterized protein EV422DRAFT_515130, partial [Fimicolochytrium jonesii]|uniref:uncharacterized protein n=1 Tax=Fimicolochytrium jonesii TaxID=1396493 RepID=UPI0022FDDA19